MNQKPKPCLLTCNIDGKSVFASAEVINIAGAWTGTDVCFVCQEKKVKRNLVETKTVATVR